MIEKSIMPACSLYSTVRFPGSHRHEVFFGSGKRQKSIDLGLYVFLTYEQHEGTRGVHRNREFDLQLKEIGQRAAMDAYGWDTERFIKEFGRNYL